MDHFNYQNDQLFAENIAVSKIAEEIATPFYLYSQATFQRHYKVMDDAIKLPNKQICYAVKANSNISILKILAALGSGADVVSGGEILRAQTAGIDASKIVFSGVGKTAEEINYALSQNIFQFNCESKEEIAMINEVAAEREEIAPIAIRINPNVDANTHDKISTGKKGDKFGVDIEDAVVVIEQAKSFKNIKFQGISVHIGSQITSLDPFEKAFRKTLNFITEIEQKNIEINTIDFGGGLGVPYGENDTISPESYGKLVTKLVEDAGLSNKKISFEPGRVIAANAGILVTSVILIKATEHKNFAICDVGMNDLMRPALYDATHQFVPVINQNNAQETYDIVGPVCETSDVFIKDLPFQTLQAGDLLAIRSAGAYGAVMSSDYNTRPLIPEILVNGDQFAVIRKRPNFAEMIKNEKIAGWL